MKIKKLFFLIIILFTLTGCENKEESLNDKAKSEIDFLSTRFISIINKLNNITFENYKVISEKAELSKESANEKESEDSSSSQNEKSEKVEKSSESKDVKSMQISPNTILTPTTTEIDWKTIKNDIENIYYSWNTIILDLYQLNIKNDDILGFSSGLDKATINIKNEDKVNSILAISNLYSFLPRYADTIYSDETNKNIIKTKDFILKSYSLVETHDWNNAKSEVIKALESFKFVTGDMNYAKDNMYKVNKCYVLLNELENSMDLKDKEIYYIKYKNLLEELVML